MSTRYALIFAAAGLVLSAPSALAQEFYVGAALSSGTFDPAPAGTEATISSTVLMAGARFDLGSNLFVGAEVQGSSGGGYSDSSLGYSTGESADLSQIELHLGYTTGQTRVFGFFGAGEIDFTDGAPDFISATVETPIIGVGAEFSVGNRTAIRVETEFQRLNYEDTGGSFEPETQSIAAGVIFSF